MALQKLARESLRFRITSTSTSSVLRRRFSTSTSQPTDSHSDHCNEEKPKMIQSLSLSGCGWLASYHFGVLQALTELGCIDNVRTKMYGASGGALAAAGFAAQLCPSDMLEVQLDMFRHCQTHGIVWKLGKTLHQSATKMVPENAHELCNGRLGIAMLRVSPDPCATAMIITNFHNKHDLLSAIYASCFLPLYLEPALTTDFRGMRVTDGGLLDICPVVEGAIKVSPFPFYPEVNFGETNSISPRILLGDKPSIVKLVRSAIIPKDEQIIRDMYMLGQESAVKWIENGYHNLH
eukprot:m.149715 g.149715  ORF g.149715 m.149715 type:complete len:293 (-) comp30678_c0_seq1:95-973(-)